MDDNQEFLQSDYVDVIGSQDYTHLRQGLSSYLSLLQVLIQSRYDEILLTGFGHTIFLTAFQVPLVPQLPCTRKRQLADSAIFRGLSSTERNLDRRLTASFRLYSYSPTHIPDIYPFILHLIAHSTIMPVVVDIPSPASTAPVQPINESKPTNTRRRKWKWILIGIAITILVGAAILTPILILRPAKVPRILAAFENNSNRTLGMWDTDLAASEPNSFKRLRKQWGLESLWKEETRNVQEWKAKDGLGNSWVNA